MPSQPQFKSDSEITKRRFGESRSDATIIRDYVLERRLSDQLRIAKSEDRGAVYASAYKEFYESTSVGKSEASRALRANRGQLRLKAIRKLLTPQTVFVEVGAGDGNFA